MIDIDEAVGSIEDIPGSPREMFALTLNHRLITLQFSIHELSTIYELGNVLDNIDESGCSHYEIQDCMGGNLDFVVAEGRFSIRLTSRDAFGTSQIFEVKLDMCEKNQLVAALEETTEDIKVNRVQVTV